MGLHVLKQLRVRLGTQENVSRAGDAHLGHNQLGICKCSNGDLQMLQELRVRLALTEMKAGQAALIGGANVCAGMLCAPRAPGPPGIDGMKAGQAALIGGATVCAGMYVCYKSSGSA